MGNHRPTLKDVANRSGYSLRTVKKVMGNEETVREATRVAVLSAARELNYKPNRLASTLARNQKIKIAAVYQAVSTAYFPEVRAGFDGFIEDFGDFGFELEYYDDPHKGWKAQKPALDAILNRDDIQGVVIQPADIAELNDAINALVRRGKPVVTFGADAPLSQRLCYVGPDAYRSGRIGAQIMGNYLKKDGKVCIISESCGHMQTIDRNHGFFEYMGEHHPGVTCQRITLADNSLFLYEEASKVLKDPELRGLFCMDANTFIAARALRDIGRQDVVLMGFDLSPETEKLMKEDYIKVILEQDPKGFSYQAIQCLADYILYQKQPPEIIHTGLRLLTSECI